MIKNFSAVLGSVCLAAVLALNVPTAAQAATGDPVTCKDGSAGKAGKGACSHHGGIDKGASAKAAAGEAKEEAKETATEGTGVTCKDGTSGKKGKGACSHHGGIKIDGDVGESKAEERKETRTEEKAEQPADKSAASADAIGATAKCKDGTYSHSKHHSGSCSHHGGVDKFLK